MEKWSLLTLSVLALALTAAGCDGPADAPAARSTGPGPVTASPSWARSTGPVTASPPPAGDPSPAPASAPALIAFVMVRDGGTGGATEVTEPGQIDRLVAGPPAAIESARAAVARNAGPDLRIFAFVLPGCQNDGAALTTGAARITATLTGGAGTACFVAEWYLAVFAVPARLVPPGARVG
ncbi:hypothetical protein [Dactylosporangium sp. NPDC049140]|jgi:hypothetical protein|uniref:hypothetical protein n=1 Tax=Dactylosporangium sp. NPDC049140 TaxID=3155647 RepID=UPI0033D6CD5A